MYRRWGMSSLGNKRRFWLIDCVVRGFRFACYPEMGRNRGLLPNEPIVVFHSGRTGSNQDLSSDVDHYHHFEVGSTHPNSQWSMHRMVCLLAAHYSGNCRLWAGFQSKPYITVIRSSESAKWYQRVVLIHGPRRLIWFVIGLLLTESASNTYPSIRSWLCNTAEMFVWSSQLAIQKSVSKSEELTAKL